MRTWDTSDHFVVRTEIKVRSWNDKDCTFAPGTNGWVIRPDENRLYVRVPGYPVVPVNAADVEFQHDLSGWETCAVCSALSAPNH
jgi:hypothetical protein